MQRIKTFMKRAWRDRTLLLMCIPALVIIIMFSYVPMTGLVMAFKKFDYSLGLYKSPWVGLKNFKMLFLNASAYWRVTRNTVVYYFLFTIVGTICEVGLAIAIYEMVFKKLGKILQSILILPTFISWVAVNYLVEAFLQNNTGLINQLLVSLGMEQIFFYLKSEYWPLILTIVKVWKNTGYGSVLYLATLSGIDTQLYEAAVLDGATPAQQRRYITLPMLYPMITIMLLLGVGNILRSDTGLFYTVTKNSGALYETTQVLDSYLLNAMKTSSDFGGMAAMTFYQSVVGCILVVVTNLIARKVSPENSLF